jgi:hypothetical protein
MTPLVVGLIFGLPALVGTVALGWFVRELFRDQPTP